MRTAPGRTSPPADTPSARYGHALAPLGGDQVLLFGGRADGIDDDTWVYDLSENRWTNQAAASAPSARYFHAMAPLGRGRVLLFGGFDGTLYDDTRVYDLSENRWTNQAPAGVPSARYAHAMAPLGGDQVLLFGGTDAAGLDGETWVATGFSVRFRVYLPLVRQNY